MVVDGQIFPLVLQLCALAPKLIFGEQTKVIMTCLHALKNSTMGINRNIEFWLFNNSHEVILLTLRRMLNLIKMLLIANFWQLNIRSLCYMNYF